MKEFNQIRKIIAEKKDAVKSEIETLNKILTAADADINDLRKQANTALEKKEIEACQKALKALAEKTDLRDLTAMQILNTNKQPWITKQEYNELKTMIFDVMNRDIEDGIMEAVKHTEALKQILADTDQKYTEANEILEILQRDGLKKENPHDSAIFYERYRSNYNIMPNLSGIVHSGACDELTGYYLQLSGERK